jgi:Flp pilus assembly protein TadG
MMSVLLHLVSNKHVSKFYRSEALNYAGFFDKLSTDNKAFLGNVKNSALKSVNNARQSVRRRLAPNGIKSTIEGAVTTEKMATMGVAAGAFVGFMI